VNVNNSEPVSPRIFLEKLFRATAAESSRPESAASQNPAGRIAPPRRPDQTAFPARRRLGPIHILKNPFSSDHELT
jgi:hypothetical protein